LIDKTKPRVCIYYHVLPSTGWRDDGAPLFLNLNLRRILNGNSNLSDHGGNVVHLAPYGDMASFGAFDLHILVDHGEDVLGVPLDFDLPHPSAYWISDAHLGYDYRMNRAKQFDFVFVAQKAFIEPLVKDGIDRARIFYLPHAFEPAVYKPIAAIEKWDWCFVGHPNSDHRIELLDRFIKAYPNYYLGWRTPGLAGHNELEDVNLKYNQARLVINDAVKEDLNLRVFEALGAGRCLITQDILEFDGEINEAFVTYKSIDEAVDLAKGLLKDDERRTRIAKTGHEAVMREHTFAHRALTILETCLDYIPKGEDYALANR
jgi:spore maturation protein CgeB